VGAPFLPAIEQPASIDAQMQAAATSRAVAGWRGRPVGRLALKAAQPLGFDRN